MTAKATGTLIGVVLVVVGIALASLSLENNDKQYRVPIDCGSALDTGKQSSLISRVCEKQIRDRRIISGVIAGAGVLTIIIASGIFATQPVRPSPTPKKLITEADFQEQQRAKNPLRREPEPQWKEADPKPTGEKKFCSQCGEKLTVGAKFCSACGVAV